MYSTKVTDKKIPTDLFLKHSHNNYDDKEKLFPDNVNALLQFFQLCRFPELKNIEKC